MPPMIVARRRSCRRPCASSEWRPSGRRARRTCRRSSRSTRSAGRPAPGPRPVRRTRRSPSRGARRACPSPPRTSTCCRRCCRCRRGRRPRRAWRRSCRPTGRSWRRSCPCARPACRLLGDRVDVAAVGAEVELAVHQRRAALDRAAGAELPLDAAVVDAHRVDGPVLGAEVDPMVDDERRGLRAARQVLRPRDLAAAGPDRRDLARPALRALEDRDDDLLVAVRGGGRRQVAHVAPPVDAAGVGVELDDLSVVADREQALADDDRRELEQDVGVPAPAALERRGDGRVGRQVAAPVTRVAVLGPGEPGQGVDLLPLLALLLRGLGLGDVGLLGLGAELDVLVEHVTRTGEREDGCSADKKHHDSREDDHDPPPVPAWAVRRHHIGG